MEYPPIKFKGKISKMGANRIVWIPLAFHEMIKEYEDMEMLFTLQPTDYNKLPDERKYSGYEAGSQVSG